MLIYARVGDSNGKVILTISCVECHTPKQITVTAEQAKELSRPDRRNIQYILPDVPRAERELLISGVCGDCWKELFAPMKDVG